MEKQPFDGFKSFMLDKDEDFSDDEDFRLYLSLDEDEEILEKTLNEPVKAAIQTKPALSDVVHETPTEISKPESCAKKFKLQVGKSYVAVPVPESNEISKLKKNTLTTPTSSNKEVNGGEPNVNPEPIRRTKNQLLKIRMTADNVQHPLTYEELEEMCVRKMCEAIAHESDLGKLRHQLSIEEEKSKKLTEEVKRLSQQTKELKQIHENVLKSLRLPASIKPIIPLRVTRSVGIQLQSCNCRKKP